jgi:hypothetical protein
MYGWGGNTTLEDIMNDEDILLQFWRTAEEGREFLGRMEEFQWQSFDA